MIEIKAEIGIILLACNIFAYFLRISGVAPPPVSYLMVGITISYFEFLIMFLGPSIVLTISGFMFYIVDRKNFLNRTKGHRIVPTLALFLGSFLLVFGLFFSIAEFGLVKYYHSKVADIGISFSDIFIEESPVLFWFVLLTISGIILAIDGWKILSVWDQKQQEKFSI